MGFIGCSAGRQPSWLSEFMEFNVAGGWLAGSGGSARSLISITSRYCCCCRHRHCLCCPSLLSSSVLPLLYTLSTQLNPFIAIHNLFPSLSLYLLPSPCTFFSFLCLKRAYRPGSSRQADSTGFVMNGILLHIRRKCTL